MAGAKLRARQHITETEALAWTGFSESESGADGQFQISGCGPGQYHVLATHPDRIADPPFQAATPGMPCTIVMRKVDVTVVRWVTQGGAAVFPDGEITLDGAPIDFQKLAEWAHYLSSSLPQAVLDSMKARQVLPIVVDEALGIHGSFSCRARLNGFHPVTASLQRWSLSDVFDGRAVADTIEVVPQALDVHISVCYEDGGREPLIGAMPLGVYTSDGKYVGRSRIGLERPGEARIALEPGDYQLSIGYEDRTFGRHAIRIETPAIGNQVSVELAVKRGSTLNLMVSPDLGPGTMVRLVGKSGPAQGFDTGTFVFRATDPIAWQGLPLGRYEAQHRGLQGRWRTTPFTLVAGEPLDLLLRP